MRIRVKGGESTRSDVSSNRRRRGLDGDGEEGWNGVCVEEDGGTGTDEDCVWGYDLRMPDSRRTVSSLPWGGRR